MLTRGDVSKIFLVLIGTFSLGFVLAVIFNKLGAASW